MENKPSLEEKKAELEKDIKLMEEHVKKVGNDEGAKMELETKKAVLAGVQAQLDDLNRLHEEETVETTLQKVVNDCNDGKREGSK